VSGDAPRFDEDGRDWPHRDASRFVTAAGLTWHVQQMGTGPALLLVHGTGAATHSWRGLAPLLAERFTVVAPDLPGHGFTQPLPAGGSTLPGMAAALRDLLSVLAVAPELAVGHSAGAAILLRMALDGAIAPKAAVSLNGALLPFRGMAGQIFSPLAKLLVWNPFLPRLFSWGAGERSSVERLIRDTGSTLDAAGLEFYLRLLRRPGHVAGALRMMANWDLEGLARDLPRLAVPLVVVVGSNDKAIAPEDARRVRTLVPGATIETLRGLGHLAHEERPGDVAAIVGRVAERAGVLPQG
jgi:magnesium chelatase accessory protein